MKIKISWKWVVIVSIIFGLFTTLALPQFNRYSIQMMGQLKSPDTSLFYSAKDLYEMAEVYGHSGREAYIKLRWTFDVIWPLLYTLFLVLWTIKLLEYISIKKTPRFLPLIPIAGMGFDFLENIGATILMYRYPLPSDIIASITPLMTLLKWITLSVSFSIIIILMLIVGLGKFKKIGKDKSSS